MLKFLATTENIRKTRREEPNDNRGKVVGKQREIAVRTRSYESRAVLFLREGRVIAGREDKE